MHIILSNNQFMCLKHPFLDIILPRDLRVASTTVKCRLNPSTTWPHRHIRPTTCILERITCKSANYHAVCHQNQWKCRASLKNRKNLELHQLSQLTSQWVLAHRTIRCLLLNTNVRLTSRKLRHLSPFPTTPSSRNRAIRTWKKR